MIRKTSTNYFSITIGFILMIYVTQVQLSDSFIMPDSINELEYQESKEMTKYSDEQYNLKSDAMFAKNQSNEENNITGLFSITPKVSKQLQRNVRINYEGYGWKPFLANNKNSISTKKLYPKKYPYFDNAPSKPAFDDRQIIFPDELSLYTSQNSEPLTCKNSVICEDVPNYPTKLIVEKLSLDKSLNSFQIHDEIIEVENRIGESPDTQSLCSSKEKVIYPKLGLNRNGEFLYIVNEKNLIQAIRVEICINENNPCNLIDKSPSGYQTLCKQKYIERQLLAVQMNGSIDKEYFQIPSSCCCHMAFLSQTWQRFDGRVHNFSPKRN